MKFYKEFTITAEPFNPEIISSLMWELEITGINEEVNCLKVFASENSPINTQEISNLLKRLVGEKMLFSFNIEENLLEEKNWNEEWEKSIKITEVSDRIIIKPTFREYKAKPDQIVITIDPKMSFGTGEHQTTKLVLQFLEENVEKDMKVLDVGSGTSILAIASVKLGAANVIAIDNDEWCYLNGKENCELNSVTEDVDVRLGEIKDVAEKNFDLVTANIQKNIIIDIAEEIRDRIKKRGILILSGLLLTDENDILKKYTALGFEFKEKKSLDEWIALSFIMP